MSGVASSPRPDSATIVGLDVLRDFQGLLEARAAGGVSPEGATLRDGMVRMAAQALLHLHDFDVLQAWDERRHR